MKIEKIITVFLAAILATNIIIGYMVVQEQKKQTLYQEQQAKYLSLQTEMQWILATDEATQQKYFNFNNAAVNIMREKNEIDQITIEVK